MSQQKKAKNKAAAASSCKVAWSTNGWDDYLYWQKHDRDIVEEINGLIEEIWRDPFRGTTRAAQWRPCRFDAADPAA
jgi:toxin YoeB